ncbi:hypothetical protein P256_01601 [Acinetobacter nectaris CIP 110549]|uniref:Thioredoxin domain-containing protein n=1 Tax=Acinetobacter nectaris CIP 110549 TaxID=1392540 RepID=V2TN79_9GAMM|nr:protein-disulfide reductase DsbD [Acinetobacter nectaris]ESK38782.1 hypothetical protein P256_01601 [Acinetobacter nectaris CIP 110549]
MGLIKNKFLAALCIFIQCCLFFTISATTRAEEPLLPAAQAFQFSANALDHQQASLAWMIAPNYYLYQHKFSIQENGHPVQLKFPSAVQQHDATFGTSLVYFNQVVLNIKTNANATYDVSWQGCAKDRLCYPPQHTQFKTDKDGFVADANQTVQSSSLLSLAPKTSDMSLDGNDQFNSAKPTTESVSNNPPILTKVNPSPLAQDQILSEKLHDHSFFYGLFLFLGLGLLLAFTPCSLPMLPILSSLIIREKKGTKAWAIALVFVCSMACVYAILGMVASYAGLGFQRWLQQPTTLIAFSILFIVFALNLFGLFEIKLPQSWTSRLDQVQSMQKGGSFIGAAVMGIISALLVGPCMTAPLAGALLFIAQTQSQWHGAVLLFVLGFGMGIPLLLVSILGTKILPKAGEWMAQIKVVFAFIMLGLALYFLRPMLSLSLMHILTLVLYVFAAIYLIYGIFKYVKGIKILFALLLIAVLAGISYAQYQYVQNAQVTSGAEVKWHVAKNAAEFEKILKSAPQGQAVVIDVYANWCVACQPIEHHILKQVNVQNGLKPFYLIKLDLSQYDTSHQALLAQWDILGPPTYLFLDKQHQERRELRLVGEFEAPQLIQQLQDLRNR